MKALAKSSYAKLATFKHDEHAERLDALNTQAQMARRVDVALGLYCFELKEVHLQHGMFGKWLAEHKPHLARQNEKGSWEAGRSLEASMSIAKSALEVCGYKIGDFIALAQSQIPRARGICKDAGQLMLLPADKLPEEFKAVQAEIFALVDGKSKRQLLSQFKQVDENGKPKIGRRKGEGGATREQRALHKIKLREMDLTERRHRIKNIGEACEALAEDAGLIDPEIADERAAALPQIAKLYNLMMTLEQRRGA